MGPRRPSRALRCRPAVHTPRLLSRGGTGSAERKLASGVSARGRHQPSESTSSQEGARRPQTRPLPAAGPQCRSCGSWRGSLQSVGSDWAGRTADRGRGLCASPGLREAQSAGAPRCGRVSSKGPCLCLQTVTGGSTRPPCPPSLLSCRDTNWQKHRPTSKWPGPPAASSHWGKCPWARQQA